MLYTEVLAIDALSFQGDGYSQFEKYDIDRELKKVWTLQPFLNTS